MIRMKRQLLVRPGLRPGFTLVELMVVIAIIVILMTLVIASYGWIQASQAEQQTKVMVTRIAGGLQQYKMDNGYFPDGNGSETSSNAVYKALFGDYTNAGIPGKNKQGQRNTIYIEELDPNRTGASSWVSNQNGEFLIMDPWNSPFRYRLGWQETDSKKKKGTGVNPDFDFWSPGIDKTTNARNLTKTGVNEDDIGNM